MKIRALASGLLFAASAATTAATLAGADSAPALAIRARVEPETATVGDLVTVTLTAEGVAGTPRIAAPNWGERWGEAEIVAVAPLAEGSAAETGGVLLRLRAFRTGSVALPARALSVRLGDLELTANTPAGLALTLRSVLPPEEAGPAEPRPAQPPVPLPVGWRFWWTLAGAMATVLALALYLSLRQRHPGTSAARERLAPLPELLRALAAIDPERVREATTATSAALRVYLRDTLGIPAPESTTTEIRQAFGRQSLDEGLARGVLDLLRDLDGVKFASRTATSNEAASWVAAARSLAEAIAAMVPEEGAEDSPRRAAA